MKLYIEITKNMYIKNYRNKTTILSACTILLCVISFT